MKSIAAVALLSQMSQESIMASGIWVAGIVLLLSITRLLPIVSKLIPFQIVRGVQLGAGLSLFLKGAKLIQDSNEWNFGGDHWLDNYVLAMLSMIVVLIFWKSKFSVSALILMIIGMIVSATNSDTSAIKIGFVFQSPKSPTGSEYLEGFFKAAISQLPLTILNSVIAVSVLADDLFPELKSPVASISKVGYFLGMMNLSSAWFGCVPYCCGSGGLAGQYRFGARTGISIVILGTTKIISGLLFGDSLLILFQSIPHSIIGILLCAAALQLCAITRNLGEFETEQDKEDAYIVMIVTAVVEAAFANGGIGFLVGLATYLIFRCNRSIIHQKKDVNEAVFEPIKIVSTL